MEQIIRYLEQLDLSEIEAKLYLKLLETGPISVKEVAKIAEIKRTTAYIYIDQLVEKGLLIKIVNGSRKQIAANKPEECLEYLVEQKIKSAEMTRQQFGTMLKKINTVSQKGDGASDAEVRYYKGKQGIKKIYEEVLKAKEVRSYVDISKIAEIFPENFTLFNNAFNENPEIKMYEIVENSSEAKEYIEFSSAKQNYVQKLLPKNIRLADQDILIYSDKVAIIHLKDKVTGVVLQNTDLYNNFKLLFDFIWKTLPNKGK